MKIKKIKENFEDMAFLLSEALANDKISEKEYNRYVKTLESAADKLDELKVLKSQMKSQEQIIADARPALRDSDEAVPESCRPDEETEQEYDEEDEYDRD